MLRRIVPLSAAVLMTLGGGQAQAATDTFAVKGYVHALAFSGSSVVVARTPSNGGLVVERRATGSAAQVAYSSAAGDSDDHVTLAASDEALAVSVQPDSDGAAPNHVLVGPAGGPLRQTAACDAGLIASPVAVSGARIAWRDGGCGQPADDPRSVTSSAIVIGGADASTPVARTELGTDLLAATILLRGQFGIAGLISPAFLQFDSQITDFGPAGLGQTIAEERGRLTAPVGILSDGTVVASIGADGGGSQDPSESCGAQLYTIAPGTSTRRALALGGCYQEAEDQFVTSTAAVGGDRVYALVAEPASKPHASARLAIAGVDRDGGDRRVVASGTYRAPIGLAADDERVAWWQPRCAGGLEVVTRDDAATGPPVTISSCRASLLTRRARVHHGRITLRVRCSQGCNGEAFSNSGARSLTRLSIRRGTRHVHLPVTKADRRHHKVRVLLDIDNGPDRSRLIRLRG